MFTRSCRKRRHKLAVEGLENRQLLAVMVATEAELTTALAGVDPCIELTADIMLTSPVVVSRAVTIDGAGFALTSGGTHRVMEVSDFDGVNNTIMVNLEDLIIEGGGGVGVGAGILNDELLTLTGVTVRDNVASESNTSYLAAGGGIATDGALVLDNSTVTGNTVTTPVGYANSAIGGGIAAEGSDSSIELRNNTRVMMNIAKTDGGGISSREGALIIDGSSVTSNSAGVGVNPDIGTSGGGIFATGTGPGVGGNSYTPVDISIANSDISGNLVRGESQAGNVFPQGGGLFVNGIGNVNIDDSTINGNTATGTVIANSVLARGGGVALVSASGIAGTLYVDVENTNVDQNVAQDGGGIYTRGYTRNLRGSWQDSTVSNNVANGSGGGWFNWAAGAGVPGAAEVTLNNTQVNNNQANGAGGIWNLIDGRVIIQGGQVAGNSAADRGGGLTSTGFGSTAEMSIRDAEISNNESPFLAGVYASLNGRITIESSLITGNSSSGNGGGVSQGFGGYVYLSDSDITGNTAVNGAALYNFVTGQTYGGILQVDRSTVSGNNGGYTVANTGFGLTNPGAVVPSLTINNSTVSGNYSAGVSTIRTYDGNTTVYQSTLSGNTSYAAIEQRTTYGYPGTAMEGVLTVNRVTIADNDTARSVYGNFYANGTVTDSLISGNTNTFGTDLYSYYETLVVNYSLLELGGSGVMNGVNGNVAGIAASLGPLANNGGPTMTHALNLGSPGMDAATPGAGAGQADQRGATPRDFGGQMDMGAFEYGATVMTFAACDFNQDGSCDGTDIDMLTMEVAAGTNNPVFDLNNDMVVTFADVEVWLVEAGALNTTCGNAFLIGDANLDGAVDGTDFIAWNGAKFTSNARWTSGDFNADGAVDGADFIAWNNNKFTSSCVPLLVDGGGDLGSGDLGSGDSPHGVMSAGSPSTFAATVSATPVAQQQPVAARLRAGQAASPNAFVANIAPQAVEAIAGTQREMDALASEAGISALRKQVVPQLIAQRQEQMRVNGRVTVADNDLSLDEAFTTLDWL